MSIKAIVLDIDGTLTNDKKEITPMTKEALLKAQAMGIKLILASGRPTKGLRKLAHELEMDQNNGYFVSYNGAIGLDCQTDEILFNQSLSIEEAKKILDHLKHFDRVRPMIDKDDYMYVTNVFDGWITLDNKPFNVMEYESRGGNYKLCEVDDLSEFVDFRLNKILTFADPDYLLENYQKIKEPFKDEFSCMFTSPFYFEFTAKGIDKAKALDAILRPIHIKPEEVIAFGDGQNDISILTYSGHGIAMENAVDELKEIADEITLSNENDGIAHTLYEKIPALKEIIV